MSPFLATKVSARLVLTGRRPLDADMAEEIKKLEERGAEVAYVPTDISVAENVAALVEESRQRFGPLDGIFHTAGVIRDSYLWDKTDEEVTAVWAPKIQGTVLLDEATANEPLECFVLFSSIAAVKGNLGQTDYASANAFMDNFAAWRNNKRERGERHGKAVSVNWPLWREGGLRVDEQTEQFLLNAWAPPPTIRT